MNPFFSVINKKNILQLISFVKDAYRPYGLAIFHMSQMSSAPYGSLHHDKFYIGEKIKHNGYLQFLPF